MSRVLQLCKKPVLISQTRSLFYWINLQFNAVDEIRRSVVGPDRVCAEWILRNGGKVKLAQSDNFIVDYNSLPDENIRIQVREIDATETSVLFNGFEHLEGCNYLMKIKLHKCPYVDDRAIALLRHVKDVLRNLQISSCGNVTDNGLLELGILHKLKELLLFDLPYVKDKAKVVEVLQKSLPKCKIEFK